MILQLLRQFLNNLDRCSASFCFGLSLRFPCPLPKRISSRILSKSMFIPQNHPKSQQRVRTCAVKEKPVFRASLALSILEIELYQISHFQWQSEIWVRDYRKLRGHFALVIGRERLQNVQNGKPLGIPCKTSVFHFYVCKIATLSSSSLAKSTRLPIVSSNVRPFL